MKDEDLKITTSSSLDDVKNMIDFLEKRKKVLEELNIAYTNIIDRDLSERMWNTFQNLRSNNDELIVKMQSMRDAISAEEGLPSYASVRETIPRALHTEDPLPSYEEATRPT